MLQLNVEDLEAAETIIVKLTQEAQYPQEIASLSRGEDISKSSKIISLSPFLDSKGLLRMSSRSQTGVSFQEKNPLIIPKSILGELIVKHYHEQSYHPGSNNTVSLVRQAGYWVIGAPSLARSLVFRCVPCRLHRKSTMTQIMGMLPRERTETSPPFTHIGIDTFGHFTVKDRRTELKRWGVVFTCAYTRAVHIEQIDDLTTDSFLQALRRFISVRGPVQTIFSDKGTNFMGGKNQLEKDLTCMSNGKLKRFMLENKINFRTNTPTASHQGGMWERQIRTIRSIFNNMTNRYHQKMSTEGLRTAFAEISAAINNRPISVENTASLEPVITANHLLTGKSQCILPPPGEFDNEEVYGRHMYRKCQQMAADFWTMWKACYLTKIEQRTRWETPSKDLEVGDVVLVVDDNQPRNVWELGRVINIHLGADHRVRKATIMLATSDLDKRGKALKERKTVERAIQKLVLIVPCKG